MIIHPERRYPRHTHDRVEVRKIDIMLAKCRNTDREPGDGGDERDPARKTARQNEQHDCARERDINRPSDHRPLRVRLTPPQLEVTICDFKFSNSFDVN